MIGSVIAIILCLWFLYAAFSTDKPVNRSMEREEERRRMRLDRRDGGQ